MTFIIGSSESFSYPVTLPRLNDDGTITRHQIKVRYKRLPVDVVQEYFARDFDPVLYADMVERAEGDKELASILTYAEGMKSGKLNKPVDELTADLLEIMSGWQDVSDESGPIEFSRDNLAKLVNFSGPSYVAIREAYREAVNGDGKGKTAKVKN